MSRHREIRYLVFGILLLVVLPIVGSIIRWGGLPPEFSLLPVTNLIQPVFNIWVFLWLGSIFVFIFAFIIIPHYFGFKKPVLDRTASILEAQKNAKFPAWFWLGAISMAICWNIMWGSYKVYGKLTHFMFVPLWASFIVFLDGILYRRNRGRSFISQRPKSLLIISFLSIFGWYYFEYLNFFVMKNWYYPNIHFLPEPGTYFWAALTFASVWPSIFLWYNILLTIPYFSKRYSHGPAIVFTPLNVHWIFIIGVSLSVLTSVWPQHLFWLIWLAPLLILCPLLARLKIWTPVHALLKGDWKPVILIAIAGLCSGFFWEFWNYGSSANNPNYWRYDLPYVQKFLIFEMPILGYSGYLFFGIEAWVMYILSARLFGFDSTIDLVTK